MKKVINSKDFWYAVFGIGLVLIIGVIAWRLIIGRVSNNSTTRNRTSYLLSPSPSPSLNPSPSTSPSPTVSSSPTATANTTDNDEPELLPESNSSENAENTNQASKGGLKIETNEDGTTYVTTESTEDEDYTASTSTRSGQKEVIPDDSRDLPDGYFSDSQELISRLLTAVMVLSAILVLYQLIMGGFNWLTSGGDKGKIDQARSRIINAVVGIIIVAASYAIFVLVLNLLGTSPEALNTLISQ